MNYKKEKAVSENKSDKKPFKDLKDLMAQIYGKDSEEFKRLEKDGVFNRFTTDNN